MSEIKKIDLTVVWLSLIVFVFFALYFPFSNKIELVTLCDTHGSQEYLPHVVYDTIEMVVFSLAWLVAFLLSTHRDIKGKFTFSDLIQKITLLMFIFGVLRIFEYYLFHGTLSLMLFAFFFGDILLYSAYAITMMKKDKNPFSLLRWGRIIMRNLRSMWL